MANAPTAKKKKVIMEMASLRFIRLLYMMTIILNARYHNCLQLASEQVNARIA